MLSLILCGLIAGAFAAPQDYYVPRPPHPPHYAPAFGSHFQPYINEDLFDTRRFWADLSREMRELDEMMADLTRRFQMNSFKIQEGIEGDEYKITITLTGFDEKDIVVKAREGLLMVQAVHKNEQGGDRSYLDLRTLPDNVNVTGSWIFEKGVLKITFPLKEKPTPFTTEAPVIKTDRPSQSREELETDVDKNKQETQDADVGLNRGDVDLHTREEEIMTNEVAGNAIEATTYAVDLKDEVEFVPVRY